MTETFCHWRTDSFARSKPRNRIHKPFTLRTISKSNLFALQLSCFHVYSQNSRYRLLAPKFLIKRTIRLRLLRLKLTNSGLSCLVSHLAAWLWLACLIASRAPFRYVLGGLIAMLGQWDHLPARGLGRRASASDYVGLSPLLLLSDRMKAGGGEGN